MRKTSSSFRGGAVSLLRAAFSQNLGLKALSFVLALGLTAYQRGSEGEEQRTVPVDVVLRLPSTEARWQNVIERSVPIQASITGRVADGYTIQSVKVDPTSITVMGPASLVDVTQFVAWRPSTFPARRRESIATRSRSMGPVSASSTSVRPAPP